jgi:predicted Zn-dependent protease
MSPSLTLAAVLAAAVGASTVEVPPQVRTAWYWEARGRDDRAAEAWQLVLASGERRDALAAVGAWHARAGRAVEARTLLARLARRWPGTPEAAQLEQAVAVGTRYRALLGRAREAARAGRLEDALARYRELFGPAPPPGALAGEYYDVCAGVAGALAEAVAGLEELVRRVPEHARYKLSLARALTYRSETRLAGIERLEALADDPAVGADASAALHRALAWLPPGQEAEAHVARWLGRHPGDHDLAAVDARQRAGGAVDAGYAALARGNLEAARRRFGEAGADDARALGGLAVIALRERDYGAAKALAERARDLAPADTGSWEATLRTANFWDAVARGRAEIAAGRYDAARALLVEATAQPAADRREVELAMAELDEARGARPEAEARLRVLAAARPRDAVVLRRLVDVLVRGGKAAEALRVNAEVARVAPALAADTRPIRAAELRARATRLRADGDPVGAREALLRARELDALDPWSLHDLAQLALERNDVAEARRLSESLVALAPDLPAARVVQARALARAGDAAGALAALDAISVGARDASVEAFRRVVEVESALGQAAPLPRPAARDRLAWAEARAGGDPDLLAAVARGWRKAGDHRKAAALFRESVQRSARPASSLRLELAAALAERGGADEEVTEMVEALRDDAALSPAERDAARDLAIGIAVRRADALRGRGDVVGAHTALATAMARDPDDARLLAADGRALLASGDAVAARKAFAHALSEDPGSVDARAGAVTVALALHEADEARRIAADGAKGASSDARAQLLLARAEVGRGDDAAAMRALDAARAAPAPPVQVGGEDIPGAVGAEVERIAARHALEWRGELVLRSRDGEGGLGALTEVRAPIAAAVPVGLTGRLLLEATPVTLDAGAPEVGQSDPAARFGSAVAAPGRVQAAGVELRTRWEQRAFSAELGSTPLGFPLRSWTGGVRAIAPAGPLQLALELSQRAVTDSVLSYAGVRDPATGQVWGGVTRDELRVEATWRDGDATRWVSAAAAVLRGTGVPRNAALQASAGADWSVGRVLGVAAHAGFSATVLGYARNLRYFTLGQGGYFSPQRLVHAGVPLRMESGAGDITWELSAEPGVNWFREEGAPGPDGAAGFPGQTTSGLAIDARARMRWAIAGRLAAQAQADAHHADGYQEVRATFGLAWQIWAPR